MPLDTQHENQIRDFKVVGTRPVRPDGLDKVTGRARYGADMSLPGMIFGEIVRANHAHAKIISIDISAAEALPGVHAVITRADFPAQEDGMVDTLDHCMADGKVLYDGHAVAAVAASSKALARKAAALVKVEYEALPHVTDVDAAAAEGAPLVREGTTSNIVETHEFGHGDPDKGFAEADVIVERSFTTEATHQGYIEPHACVANMGSDGVADIWCCTQGHFMVRNTCAAIMGMSASQLRVTASEIGGGFGGKTSVYIEPTALALSKKAGRPVKIVMSREDVFRASGPTASSSIDVKIGAKKDGTIVAGHATLRYQGGAWGGSLVDMGAMAAFACYDIPNVKAVGHDVLANRPKLAAYRAPSAPMAAFAVESVVTELADELGLDPLDFRLKNCARAGTKSSYGPRYGEIGLEATLQAAKDHPHWSAPLPEGQGRGVACGFWFNFGGQTSSSLNINEDGTVGLSVGTPDIGGSRAAMCQMAAEALGIPYEKVRAIVADTASLGYNDVTDGSRTTFASGLAVINSANQAVERLCERAAQTWDIPVEAVEWKDGAAHPAGANAGNFAPLSLAEIAATSGSTGGPIAGHSEINADGAGVSFGTHICDVEVDQETGRTTIKRYTVIQDAGKAIHPDYVEGQFQGGAAQGIGWALNEEYIYGEDGLLQNAGFLDYRIPVASDLPMIDTQILEIPNPGHPYGVRGVGETPIVPPLATVAHAIKESCGQRMTSIPMSPPKVLAALKAASQG
jgi:CO/xanthine dehydrogenase Mo-binding subunit